VDAVLVTSWGPCHESFVLVAIAEGKTVFCEKALGVTAEGFRRFVDSEIAYGIRLLLVCYMRPFDEGKLALKAVIYCVQIGERLLLH
ncbi:inositol 2-dehydrogenase, partial [Pseudomonas sp. CCI2.4]|nr:inositol 2-dehydrogenase [Pseudomonas sp. CCI2.4]